MLKVYENPIIERYFEIAYKLWILFLSKSGFVKVSIGEILLEDKIEEGLFVNVIMYIVK